MNTFDLLGAMELTVSASVLVGALTGGMTRTRSRQAGAIAAFALWFVLVALFAAIGGFDARFGVGIRWVGVAAALPVIALTWAGAKIGRFRTAIAAIPLPVLVGVHAVRVLGISFVLLYAAHRLAAPFAPVAGWGDIFIGVTALPLAFGLARNPARFRRLALVWNTLGILDLIAAVGLGILSAPGTPFQIFTAEPGSRIMGSLPWVLIPAFLVPILMLTAFAIARREFVSPAAAATRN